MHTTPNRSLSIRLFLPLIVFCLVAMPLCFPTPIEAETTKAAGPLATKQLEGRWLRPDGGYILELKEIRPDGTIKAAYFNPKPIKVGKAELHRKEGKTVIFVELRDVNYPGSQYNLTYDQTSDRLTGTYFQAVQKQTYEVEFVRTR